jgi:hypothetical protein
MPRVRSRHNNSQLKLPAIQLPPHVGAFSAFPLFNSHFLSCSPSTPTPQQRRTHSLPLDHNCVTRMPKHLVATYLLPHTASPCRVQIHRLRPLPAHPRQPFSSPGCNGTADVLSDMESNAHVQYILSEMLTSKFAFCKATALLFVEAVPHFPFGPPPYPCGKHIVSPGGGVVCVVVLPW